MRRLALLAVGLMQFAWLVTGGLLKPCDCAPSPQPQVRSLAPCCEHCRKDRSPVPPPKDGSTICPQGPQPMEVPAKAAGLPAPTEALAQFPAFTTALRPLAAGRALPGGSVWPPGSTSWRISPESLSVFLV